MCTEEDKLRARLQVEAFLTLLLDKYGIHENEIPDLLSGARRMVNYSNGVNRLSWVAVLSILGLAITGLGSFVSAKFGQAIRWLLS